VSYWVARTEHNHAALALHCLALRNFETYYPLTSEKRVQRGRHVTVKVPLFINYVFIKAGLQWSDARWCIGVTDLIMGNGGPAQVADAVVNEIRARERNGIVQLPQRPPPRRGDPVRVWRGLFAGQLGLFQGMRGSERVIVLLQALGHVTLPRDDVEVV
jgi:transcriptional antiterminator RfaH